MVNSYCIVFALETCDFSMFAISTMLNINYDLISTFFS